MQPQERIRLTNKPRSDNPPTGFTDIVIDGGVPKYRTPDGEEHSMGGGASESDLNGKLDKTAVPWIDVTLPPYNAKGDAQTRSDATMTNGSAVLTSTSANFTTSDVGKYIRVANADTAGADLITTIVSRQSSTQVTLGNTAKTNLTPDLANVNWRSKVYCPFWWGTNDTTAIQNAINAATEMVPRPAILFGVNAERGAFLCNLTVPKEMKLIGFNGGTALGNLYENLDRYSDPKWCCSLMPAVSTSAVVYYPDAFGTTIERLCFVGGGDKAGKAIQLGALNASSFVGLGITLDRVMITGFDECIRNIFCNQVNIIGGNWLDSNKGIWFGKDTASGWGGVTINGLQTVRVEDVFTGAVGTGIRVTGTDGDFNYGTRIAKVEGSGMFQWTNINIEDFDDCVAEIISGSSTASVSLNGISRLRSDIPLVKNSAGSTHIHITGETTNGGFYRTNGSEIPNFLDRTIVIERYNTDYSILLEREWASLLYKPQTGQTNQRGYEETWTRNLDSTAATTANGIGQLGFQRTNIQNAFFNTTDGGLLGSPQPGCLGWHSTNNSTVANRGRLALSNHVGYVNGSNYFRYEFSFWISSTQTASKWRYGLYNLTTGDMNPTNGIGIVYDAALSSYIQLELMRNGTPTRVSTDILPASLNSPQTAVKVRLERRSGGVYLMLRNHISGATIGRDPSLNGGVSLPFAQLNSTATVTDEAVTPCFLSEITSATAFLCILYPNLSLRFVDSY
jgi:hypothetical protein